VAGALGRDPTARTDAAVPYGVGASMFSADKGIIAKILALAEVDGIDPLSLGRVWKRVMTSRHHQALPDIHKETYVVRGGGDFPKAELSCQCPGSVSVTGTSGVQVL
jgi:hypothetical protein